MSFAELDAILSDLTDDAKFGNNTLPNGIAVIARDIHGAVLFRGRAVILLQLVESGVLTLEELEQPVPQLKEGADLLHLIITGYSEQGRPVFAKAKRRPTWLELANHTAGLGYRFASESLARHMSETEPEAPLGGDRGPLVFEPGTSWSYAGGMATIGFLIKDRTGNDLDFYLQRDICTPLGLTKTHFSYPDSMTQMWPRRETPRDTHSPWKEYEYPHLRVVRGDCSLVSSANDFSKLVAEVTLAVSAQPNKLFKRLATASLLHTDRMTDATRTAMLDVVSRVSAPRAFSKDLRNGSWHFGLGYLCNAEDTQIGRRGGSMSWEGRFGAGAILDPKTGIALHTCIMVDDIWDPVVVRAHDQIEAAFYRCLNAA